ncbi:MAG TPA: hypothetical protein VJG90_03845 [Candidatus Nanoarchaeia archaeon]|nr:hypothetical protein [Candidatus Nanoarchaeia archaeon]
MDETPTPKTTLPILAIIILFISATLYWAPLLDLAHRGRTASTRDYLLTGNLAGKLCGHADGELQQICGQMKVSNWTAYGLFVVGLVFLVWGLIKKKTNYDKKDLAIYMLVILFCGFLFYTLSSYRIDKEIEKTPIETYDTQVTEHTINYEAESEVTEEVLITTEEVNYYDTKGNLLKPLEATQYQQGVGSPCRPWAELKNPNEVNINFDANFTYTIYDIIAAKKTITVPDQTIKASATTKVIYSQDEEGSDGRCQLSEPHFIYHEDENVKKKVKTTTELVNQTRTIQNNKTPDVYNETKKVARTQYIENIHLVGKWWWQ